jgi:hypothetical protein
MSVPANDASRDLLANWVATAGFYWLPIAALFASEFFDIGQGWRTAVWVSALSTMGIACLLNARRCGRVHCYATGPFFLLMALATLVYGFGWLPIGRSGWNTIGVVVLVGAVVLRCVPEALLGKYRHASPSDR